MRRIATDHGVQRRLGHHFLRILIDLRRKSSDVLWPIGNDPLSDHRRRSVQSLVPIPRSSFSLWLVPMFSDTDDTTNELFFISCPSFRISSNNPRNAPAAAAKSFAPIPASSFTSSTSPHLPDPENQRNLSDAVPGTEILQNLSRMNETAPL